MNTVLDPIVGTYIKYFGTRVHPVVWEVGSRDGRDAGFDMGKYSIYLSKH